MQLLYRREKSWCQKEKLTEVTMTIQQVFFQFQYSISTEKHACALGHHSFCGELYYHFIENGMHILNHDCQLDGI